MLKIAVLVSGGGSNLQAIIDKIQNGYLKHCTITAVISDQKEAYAIERAKQYNLPTYVLPKKEYKGTLSDKILEILLAQEVDFIVLAGFLSILKGALLHRFKDKIINIHPSLIPAFCGPGMYGMKVHEKAIEYGVKVAGCTVHFVDEGTDTGPILIQKTVPVYDEDTPKALQERVLVQEHEALPEALYYISEGKVQIEERKVKIL